MFFTWLFCYVVSVQMSDMSDIWTLSDGNRTAHSNVVHIRMARQLHCWFGMKRLKRPLGEGLCYHVRTQCNNQSFRFTAPEDFERYIALLTTVREKHPYLLHHFTIMHTHVHLIITTPGPVLLDTIMHAINQRYALDYHRRHQRVGHFWMNSYRCSVIDTDQYAWTCMRYLDRNAVRAGLVSDPKDWPWCSHNFYANGDTKYALDPHTSYLSLAETPEERQRWYRDFVWQLLPSDETRDKELITRGMKIHGPQRQLARTKPITR